MTELDEKQKNELLIEIATVVRGIPGTDQKGMAGDIRVMNLYLKELNGMVKKNTLFRKISIWAYAIIFIALVGALVQIFIIGG